MHELIIEQWVAFVIGPTITITMQEVIHKIVAQSQSVVDPEFSTRAAPTPKMGALTYYFAKILHKLHENERIWTEVASLVPLDPPL